MELRRGLVGELAAQGLLEDPRWRRAVEAVPRHRFVPGFYADSGRRDELGLIVWKPVTARTDRARWLEGAYSDTSLITQFDGEEVDWENPAARTGGEPSSSSTLPSLVLRMWQDADLPEGANVLEIGTGTGYSTALACERLGQDGDVMSIEVDQARLAHAAAALNRCGYPAGLAVADGLHGYWPHAPYDRIVAACSVRTIPAEWLAQTRPGGKILTTLSGWLYGHARVLLTVTGPGTAHGPLLPGTVSFMPARAHQRPAPGNPADWNALTRHQAPRPARHDPELLTRAESSEAFFARFLAQLAAPGAQLLHHSDDHWHLVDLTTGSAAAFTRHSGSWQVRQTGPARLWDAIENAWDAWADAGRPGPEHFCMTTAGQRQTIAHPADERLVFTLP